MLSPQDIWVVEVGNLYTSRRSYHSEGSWGPFIVRWNGTEWSSDQCVDKWFPGASRAEAESVYGVAGASAEEVWAVTGESGEVVDLVHHAPCPTPIPTMTPVPTDTPIYYSPTPYGYVLPPPPPTIERPIVPPGPGTKVVPLSYPQPIPSKGVK